MGRAASADHGILATLHPERGSDLVPVCFAIVGELVGVPIDRVKPKADGPLGRVRNLAVDPRATLLVEHWNPDDWSRLWWVRLGLRRGELEPAERAELEASLRGRYRQYHDAEFEDVIGFTIVGVTGWSAS
jgi:hypothetical protein